MSAATACTASLRSLPLEGAGRWSWPAVAPANKAECRLGAGHAAARTDCPFAIPPSHVGHDRLTVDHE
jgi:hypothetical protein